MQAAENMRKQVGTMGTPATTRVSVSPRTQSEVGTNGDKAAPVWGPLVQVPATCPHLSPLVPRRWMLKSSMLARCPQCPRCPHRKCAGFSGTVGACRSGWRSKRASKVPLWPQACAAQHAGPWISGVRIGWCQPRFYILFSYPKAKRTWRYAQVLDSLWVFGGRWRFRTSDPSSVNAVLYP